MKTAIRKTIIAHAHGRAQADALAMAVSNNWRIDAHYERAAENTWNIVVFGRKPNNATIQAVLHFAHGFRTAWNYLEPATNNQ